MNPPATPPQPVTAFLGPRRLASGPLAHVAAAAKAAIDRGTDAALLTFDDATGRPVDLDLRGTLVDVRERYADGTPAESAATRPVGAGPNRRRSPGRPKLGVVGREVTLLPRHWDWLNEQPGGASVTLRKLVEQARRAGVGSDRRRRAQEAAYRFMSAVAGDRPGFEEATRALFAGDRSRFEQHTADWPADVAEYAATLAAAAFDELAPGAR